MDATSNHVSKVVHLLESLFPNRGNKEFQQSNIYASVIPHPGGTLSKADEYPEQTISWDLELDQLSFFVKYFVRLSVLWSTRSPEFCSSSQKLIKASIDHFPCNEADHRSLYGPSERIMSIIARVTELDRWKCDASEEGNLSILELADGAWGIKQDLHVEIESCTNRLNAQTRKSSDSTAWGHGFSCHGFIARTSVPNRKLSTTCEQSGPCLFHSKMNAIIAAIFAYAAEIYLHLVVSGVNRKIVEIRQNFTKVMPLIRHPELENHLNLIAWPLCVVGCLVGYETDLELSSRVWYIATLEDLESSVYSRRARRIKSAIERAWKTLDAEDTGTLSWTQALEMWELDPNALL